ncbi:MAG: SsrA-binding protein SmpB [Patescibacteria group bacterium]
MSLISNKKSHFNYEITDTYSAGIELFGFEVKSVRKGQGSLEGSYVTVRGDEAFIIGSFIPAFQEKNAPKDYDSRRNRKLLLTKKEIQELRDIEKTKGLTIVPISMYNKGRVLKLDLGVGKGKKKFDKRESIKKQDTEREMRRDLKR